jgi:hypothetical protein
MLLPVYSHQEEGDMDVSNSKKDGMTAGPNPGREWRPELGLPRTGKGQATSPPSLTLIALQFFIH